MVSNENSFWRPHQKGSGMRKVKIGGVIQSKELVQVGIMSMPSHPGLAGKIFCALGKEGINIQFIAQAEDLHGRGNTTFCIHQGDLQATRRVLNQIQPFTGSEKVIYHSPVGIISIFGPHFRERPSIAGTMFSALGDAGIRILAISTSISTLSCVIEEKLLPQAVQAVSEAFEPP
jgi:aspartate kinase